MQEVKASHRYINVMGTDRIAVIDLSNWQFTRTEHTLVSLRLKNRKTTKSELPSLSTKFLNIAGRCY